MSLSKSGIVPTRVICTQQLVWTLLSLLRVILIDTQVCSTSDNIIYLYLLYLFCVMDAESPNEHIFLCYMAHTNFCCNLSLSPLIPFQSLMCKKCHSRICTSPVEYKPVRMLLDSAQQQTYTYVFNHKNPQSTLCVNCLCTCSRYRLFCSNMYMYTFPLGLLSVCR